MASIPRIAPPDAGPATPSDGAVDLIVCPACSERMPPRAVFCMACGSRMVADSGERKDASVLFADLSGFTSYSERSDVEAVKQVASAAADELGEIVMRYGGTIDKIIGDCIVAVWGLDGGRPDDAERAVRAALDMQTHATEWRERFGGMKLTIGVDSGEVVSAPVGPSGEHTVFGDTVNAAARLQHAAARGEVLVGESTATAVASSIAVEPADPIPASEPSKPIPAFRAIGVAGSTRARVRRPSLIGRRLEVARLYELWQGVTFRRQPHLVTLVGDKGLGKSRLIETFAGELGADAIALIGHCLSYGAGLTYWPIIEIVTAAAGILHDDDDDEVSAKLGALLESFQLEDLDQLRTMAVALAHLVASPTTPRGTYSAEKITRAELHWGIRRLLDLLSAQRPILIVIEDVHWAEPALLDLIEYLGDLREGTPIMIVIAGRPEIRERAGRLMSPALNRRTIEVTPLSDDEVNELVSRSLGEAWPPLIAVPLSQAQGNPLAIEETLQLLIDRGHADEHGAPVGDPSAVPVPADLTGIIQERLAALPDDARSAIGAAALIGQIFWDGAAAYAMGGAAIGGALRVVDERGLAAPRAVSTIAGHTEWSFKHTVIRDAALRVLSPDERAAMHEGFGRWVTALADTEMEFVEFIAFHLSEACRLMGSDAPGSLIDDAVDALERAAVKSDNHGATAEAEAFFAEALVLLGDRDLGRAIRLGLKRAQTLAWLGRAPEAIQILTAIVEADHEESTSVRALLDLAQIDHVRAAEHLERARVRMEPIHDERLAVEYAALAGSQLRTTDPAASVTTLRAALSQATALDDPGLEMDVLRRLGHAYLATGDLSNADRTFGACIDRAHGLGSVLSEADATASLATVKFFRGPRDRAEELAERTLMWLERAPDVGVEIATRKRLAWLASARGERVAAEEYLRGAVALAEPIAHPTLPVLYRDLAGIFTLLRRPREARRAAEAAVAAAVDGDDVARGAAVFARAYCEALEVNTAEARALFEEGLSLIAADPLDQGLNRINYARALTFWGEVDDAREQLTLARALFEPLGADAIIADIDEAEAALGPSQR